jgi:hypothetical protein
MAYHIVETLRISFDKSIREVQAEKEEAAKMKILQDMKKAAQEKGKSEAFLQALEIVFRRFAEVKPAEDFTEAFQKDIMTFASMMQEAKSDA